MPQNGGWRYWATCSRYGMADSLLLPCIPQIFTLFSNGITQSGLRTYSEMTQCSQPKPNYKEFKCPFHRILTNTMNTMNRVLPHPVCLYNVPSMWCPCAGGTYHHNYSMCHQPHLIQVDIEVQRACGLSLWETGGDCRIREWWQRVATRPNRVMPWLEIPGVDYDMPSR